MRAKRAARNGRANRSHVKLGSLGQRRRRPLADPTFAPSQDDVVTVRSRDSLPPFRIPVSRQPGIPDSPLNESRSPKTSLLFTGPLAKCVTAHMYRRAFCWRLHGLKWSPQRRNERPRCVRGCAALRLDARMLHDVAVLPSTSSETP